MERYAVRLSALQQISALFLRQTVTYSSNWSPLEAIGRGSRLHHLMHVRTDRVGLLHHQEPTRADEAQDQQRNARRSTFYFDTPRPHTAPSRSRFSGRGHRGNGRAHFLPQLRASQQASAPLSPSAKDYGLIVHMSLLAAAEHLDAIVGYLHPGRPLPVPALNSSLCRLSPQLNELDSVAVEHLCIISRHFLQFSPSHYFQTAMLPRNRLVI
ncbi:hypothetical protein V490_04829 [Pseudogymnoascus sp. VKM F-3557]|nr:hypothetical protein V490_04829 [Pseudogymnoascus sp. VKM F-3557]